MNISARVTNQLGEHTVVVETNGREQSLAIAHKADGYGSSVNGGELLFLALATCYCNDLYREGRKRGIEIAKVEVEVSGEFGAEGAPAKNVRYRASVDAKATREIIVELMRHTDTIAEIQNTLRASSPIILEQYDARQL